MRKHITKILALLALSLFTIACSENNFESKFNDSSDERLKTSIDDYSDLLSSSDKGWLLEYYPESNQVYGGFNYAIKFEDGKVSKVSYELAGNLSETESSTYDIIALGGPVLTFNTYNKFMHEFATPSGSSYQAKKGDYEFYLTSKSDNTITLKGVRSGNTMRMIKLEETPEEYLTKVKNINDYLINARFSKKGITVASSNRNFTFTGEGKDGADLKIAYIITDKGIKLYDTVNLDGSDVSEFILDKTANTLTSINGNVVIDIAPFGTYLLTPYDFGNENPNIRVMRTNSTTITIDESTLPFVNFFEGWKSDFVGAIGAPITRVYIRGLDSAPYIDIWIPVTGGNARARFDCTYTVTQDSLGNNIVKFTFNSVSPTNQDFGLAPFFKPWTDFIFRSSGFYVQKMTPLNPNQNTVGLVPVDNTSVLAHFYDF